GATDGGPLRPIGKEKGYAEATVPGHDHHASEKGEKDLPEDSPTPQGRGRGAPPQGGRGFENPAPLRPEGGVRRRPGGRVRGPQGPVRQKDEAPVPEAQERQGQGPQQRPAAQIPEGPGEVDALGQAPHLQGPQR